MNTRPSEEKTFYYKYRQDLEPVHLTSKGYSMPNKLDSFYLPVKGSEYCLHKDSCAYGNRSSYDIAQNEGKLFEMVRGTKK